MQYLTETNIIASQSERKSLNCVLLSNLVRGAFCLFHGGSEMQLNSKSRSLEALNDLYDAEAMIMSGDFNAKDVVFLISRSRMNLGGNCGHSKGKRKQFFPRVLSRGDAFKVADIFQDDMFPYYGIEDILKSILSETYQFDENSTPIGEDEFKYYEVSLERIERFQGMLEMATHLLGELFMNLSEPFWWVDLKDFKAYNKRMREEGTLTIGSDGITSGEDSDRGE